MIRMAASYGHFTLDDLQGAMETIRSTKFGVGALENSPVSEGTSASADVN
jgi:hypothetical protein